MTENSRFLALLAAAVLLVVALTWRACRSEKELGPPSLAENPLAPSPVPAPVSKTSPVPGTRSREEATPLDRSPLRDLFKSKSFDDFLARLVELGTQLTAAVESHDPEAARELDQQTREELKELHRSFPAPEELALSRLADLDPGGTGVESRVRRKVCLLLLTQGLERRDREARAIGDRSRLDALVSAVLGTLPQNDELAHELGMGLVDRPYLGLAHEDTVLDLLALTAERKFPEEVSTALLLTLWRNLAETGARTSGELASLALLFKDRAGSAGRFAALVHLLQAEGGRYRDLILEEVCGRKERGVARELGLVAARDLAPPEALAVLERLATVAGEDLMPAFMILGRRDSEVLAQAYERRLADNADPELRAELVTGTGSSGTPASVELARKAFRADPSPMVRARAMFAITAHAGEALGEETVTAALDDPELSRSPSGLGKIALAVENLAANGMGDAVRRLGTRLMSRSNLLPGDRARLAEILSRTLPEDR